MFSNLTSRKTFKSLILCLATNKTNKRVNGSFDANALKPRSKLSPPPSKRNPKDKVKVRPFRNKKNSTCSKNTQCKVKVTNIDDLFDKPEHNYYTNVSSPKATTSVSSTSSSVKRQRIKAQEANLANIQKVLDEKISQVKEEFTFVEYLEVLKSLSLVCSNFLTPQEESLVTRSWHTISFYQNGNIVTNADNIKVFIAGVLGVNEEWMFSQVSSYIIGI